jgi:hypothetical protein
MTPKQRGRSPCRKQRNSLDFRLLRPIRLVQDQRNSASDDDSDLAGAANHLERRKEDDPRICNTYNVMCFLDVHCHIQCLDHVT